MCSINYYVSFPQHTNMNISVFEKFNTADSKIFEVVFFLFLNNSSLEGHVFCIIILIRISIFLHFYVMYIGQQMH